MSPEVAEIVHDAVKIGLGAVIGGGFTIWATNLASKRRREEDLVAKRRDHILDITKRFSRLHTLFTDHWSSKISALIFEHDESEDAKTLKEWIEEELFEREPEIYEGLTELHELEAEVCLLGAPDIAEVLERYRYAVTGVGDLPEVAEVTQKEAILELQQKSIMEARATFVVHLMAFYKSG